MMDISNLRIRRINEYSTKLRIRNFASLGRFVPFFLALALLSAGCNLFSKNLPAGVIKSVNGGADWQFANILKGVEKGSLGNSSISRLDFDPQNRQTVFASSYTDGLFKSEDSGQSWSRVLSQIFVYDFAINPLDPKIIYAGGFYADHGRLLKTSDGGASWVQIYNEASLQNAVRAVALNPLNPNQLVIGTTSGSVVKSSDGGNTWQLAKNFDDKVNRLLWQNGNIYALLRTKGLFKSTDFGVNFSDLTASIGKAYFFGQVSYNTLNPVEFFNQAYVDFTAAGLIYFTTNRGIYKTVDDGKNWQLLKLPVKPDQADAQAIAISKASSNIVFTSVGSTAYKSLDGGVSWQTQSLNSAGYINYILVDPQLPQIVYGGVYIAQ